MAKKKSIAVFDLIKIIHERLKPYMIVNDIEIEHGYDFKDNSRTVSATVFFHSTEENEVTNFTSSIYDFNSGLNYDELLLKVESEAKRKINYIEKEPLFLTF
jgi:hypothetical protein